MCHGPVYSLQFLCLSRIRAATQPACGGGEIFAAFVSFSGGRLLRFPLIRTSGESGSLWFPAQ